MIGHDLAGRYEIISRIGGGGMALVYKAHDLLLNRNVAVKVLRQQFVNDDEFIRRFRREAQSAAALSHPNVVSIYDVGQEDDIHYIVMEYVEGRNLNELIAEQAPLQVEQAVHIAYQIADALDHAHANHIVHRDIKPHNILIGLNGRVKVTDFGIARAVTSSTITHTGSVVGSVHYFSPEHAKGINTGEKSDLYSLGIVLYQMLTGSLPFFGESPISIALKHLQDDFAEPRTINPHIPQSVENIILRAMRKNPNERYNSAKDLMRDLETCLDASRANEAKLVFTPVYNDDLVETKVMPAIRGSSIEKSAIEARPNQQAAKDELQNTNKWNNKELQEETSWKRPLIVVVITLVLLAALVWGFFKLLDKLDTDEVEIPYVVGETEAEARRILEEAGLKIEEPIARESSKTVPEGIVLEQSKMSMTVKVGNYIQLTVSSGPELKELSSFVGMDEVAAINQLVAFGIKSERIQFKEVHDDAVKGTILEQIPEPGTEVNTDTVEIIFTVSAGPETVTMPDLVDMRLKDAKSLLKSYDLVLEEANIKYEPSYLHEKDFIISQGDTEPNSEIPKGSSISIVVSSGYPEDARTYQFSVKISPASSESASEVKIYYSDARGEDMQLEPHTITSTVNIPVTLVLDPDTEARVTVYRDGSFMDSKVIKFSDIVNGSSQGITIGEDDTMLDPNTQVDEQTTQSNETTEDLESNEQEATENEQP